VLFVKLCVNRNGVKFEYCARENHQESFVTLGQQCRDRTYGERDQFLSNYPRQSGYFPKNNKKSYNIEVTTLSEIVPYLEL